MFKVFHPDHTDRLVAAAKKHQTEHPDCLAASYHCDAYTDEFLRAYACEILDKIPEYPLMFQQGSRWRERHILGQTMLNVGGRQKFRMGKFDEARLKHEKLVCRMNMISHYLEIGEDYDVYDIAQEMYAKDESVTIHQEPVMNVLISRVADAIRYLIIHGHDVSEYRTLS